MAGGKWIKFEKPTYMDPTGKRRTSETEAYKEERTVTDGVAISPVMQRALCSECIVLGKQCQAPWRLLPRIPRRSRSDNESPEAAALRELE